MLSDVCVLSYYNGLVLGAFVVLILADSLLYSLASAFSSLAGAFTPSS